MNAFDAVPTLGCARVATEASHHLAEGPVWDGIRQRLLWVDILAGSVCTGRLDDGGGIEPLHGIVVPGTASAVAVSEAGELVIAGTHRLHYVDAAGAITAGRMLIQGADRRFNDGKPDPAGRFLVGTKGPGDEHLLRMHAGEITTIIDDDLTLSNGLAWSPDGHRFYSIDTGTRRIFVRDYDPDSGETGERRVLVQLEHGFPDGMTVDADGMIWVAVWGQGCVLRITAEGEIIARVDVPAPQVSCPAFAGPDLGTLVITTAAEEMTAEQLEEHPHSGCLFTFDPGVRGAQPHYWSGER